MPNFHGKKLAGMFLVILCLLGIQACGGGSSTVGGGGSTTTTSFEGAIAGASDTTGQTGTVSIAVQAAVAKSAPFSIIRTAYASDTVTTTGTLTISGGGGTVDLTGTYNTSTGELNLTGAGGYTFTGTITGGVMSGNYDNGSADTDIGGGFAGLNSTTYAVKVLCGTFEHGTGDTNGTFNLIISSDNTVSGVRINAYRKHTYRTLSGTKDGNTVTAIVDDNGREGTGTLSADGNSITGTFVNGDGTTGDFAGSVSECQ